MQFKFNFVIFTILAVFLVSFASAQDTVVIGKVFKVTGGSVGTVNIAATCNGETVTGTTNQGDYAINFADSVCTLGDSITVVASIDNWKGQDSTKAKECEATESSDCNDISAVAVINPIMTETIVKKKSGSSSSRTTSSVSPVVKNNTSVLNTTNSIIAVANVSNNITNITQPIVLDEEVSNETSDERDLSGVTGYSVFGGSGSWIGASILIVIVILVIIVAVVFSKRK